MRVLVSYPKSGRSWLWYAACLAVSKHYGIEPRYAQPDTIDKNQLFAAAGLPVATSTHAMFGDEPEKTEQPHRCLLERDPRDIITSTFYWRNRDNWEQHVEKELNSLRKWRDSWIGQDFELMLTYEQLQSDFGATLERFLDWLGAEHSPASIDYARELSRFDRMRDRSNPRKCRKGIVGDWQAHMSPAQGQRILEAFA